MGEPLKTFDNISKDEELRRDFFKRHISDGQWSCNVFQLRDLNPPENYLSFSRAAIAPDAVSYAKSVYVEARLKKLLGYALLKAEDILNIDAAPLKISLLTTDFAESPHAGLFTYRPDGVILEGSVEDPDVLRLKNNLLALALPTYSEYDSSELLD